MIYSVKDIHKFLSETFSSIRFLEAEGATTGRFREKHVIVFEYENVAGKSCVLKFFVLQHIEQARQKEEMQELLREYNTINAFGTHPNIVRVFDANELRRESKLIGFYITMEKFDTTLAGLLQEKGRFTEAETEAFLTQMDTVLHHAHYELDQPIVHSDIKPANIGVRKTKNGYEYALMDFDVSVTLERQTTDEASFTLTNKASMRGITLAYAPPEQVMAYLHRSGNISNRVDVYAVGAIAMQMLTGLAPVKIESQVYYKLPFGELPNDWIAVFEVLCAPNVSNRSRRISEALSLKGNEPQGFVPIAGQTQDDDGTRTIVVGKTSGSSVSSNVSATASASSTEENPPVFKRLLIAAIFLCVIGLGYLLYAYTSGDADRSLAGLFSASPVEVELRTIPGGAEVLVDGQRIGTSDEDGILTAQLLPGSRTVELQKDGYEPVSRTLTISEAGPNSFAVSMDPRTGRLTVRVEPEDTQVEIDGEAIPPGEPVDLRAGTYVVRATKSGYGTAEQQVEITPGEAMVLPLTIQALPARLNITANPQQTDFVLTGPNGQEVARWRGNRNVDNLAAGAYRLTAQADNHEPWSQNVTLEQGQNRTVSATLQRSTGSLQVQVSPSNANVTLMDASGREVQRWQGNRSLENLPTGNYRIRGQLAEYHEQESNVRVSRNEQTSVMLELELIDTCGQPITDIDGNRYRTVRIGDQCWMAENLNTSRYRDGGAISNVRGNSDWANLRTGAWAYYDNSASNGRTYGKLYNWYAVDDNRGLCPEGWRVPSDGDWTELENYLGGRSVAGGKLKATGTQYWRSPNTGATNESGFSGLPGGWRNFSNGTFFYLGSFGYWWSSSESNTDSAWRRRLGHDNAAVGRSNDFKRHGFSVRCVGD